MNLKLKTLALWKTVLREWRQAIDREKIFVSHISVKGLISKIYQELLKFNNKKRNHWIQKWQKTWIDISPKKKHRWQISIWKKYSASFIIREVRIKTKRFCRIPTRISKIPQVDNTKCWWGWETRTLIHSVAKSYSRFGRQFGNFFF